MARNPERDGYTPTEDLHLTTKEYVDSVVVSLQAQVTSLAAQVAALGGGGIPDPSLVPSYANADGTGDRTATITVTSSTGLLVHVGVGYRFVDGSIFFDNYMEGVDVSIHWIAFDFGEPVYITEARWYAANGDCKTWKWQASNDGSLWSDITPSFTLDSTGGTVIGGTPVQIIDMSTNMFVWQYYRLKGVSGTLPAPGPYLFEAEFKIDR